MISIRDDLALRGTLVSDGAWGTFIIIEELGAGECPELWNATHPDVIRKVAEAYADAGADCIITKSFGGSCIKLDYCGLAPRTAKSNEALREQVVALEGGGTDAGDVYPLTPAEMQAQVLPLMRAGATIVGDCCGTNSHHIAAIARATRSR